MTAPPATGPAFVIVGSARAGTTLVQRLACELEGIAMPPETHFFDLFVRDLLRRGPPPFDGDRIAYEVTAWSSMPELRGVVVDPRAIVAELGGSCDSVGRLFDAIVRSLVDGAPTYGEKTPNHLYWWRPLAKAFPELTFVAVVRDPRSVVASTLASPWAGTLFHHRWGTDTYVAMAERFRFELDLVLAMQRDLGPRCLVLRYEDVVVDPVAARSAIAALVGVPDRERVIPSGIVLPWEEWKLDALKEVHTRRVASWREDLGDRRGRVVASVCDPVMRRFGYRVSNRDRISGRMALATLNPLTHRRRRKYRQTLRQGAGWIDTVIL